MAAWRPPDPSGKEDAGGGPCRGRRLAGAHAPKWDAGADGVDFSNMDEHIKQMSKPSNRDRLLQEGLKVVHERGYMGASVRDIVQAAGVPQGSFTNHFASKEAFALEVLDLYYAGSVEIVGRSLKNRDLPPLERLRAYIRENKDRIRREGVQNGCLYGNFSAEAVDRSEPIRERIADIFKEAQKAVEACLTEAAAGGAAPRGLDAEKTAAFFVSSLQGAILLAKARRDLTPIDQFEAVLFSSVLHSAS